MIMTLDELPMAFVLVVDDSEFNKFSHTEKTKNFPVLTEGIAYHGYRVINNSGVPLLYISKSSYSRLRPRFEKDRGWVDNWLGPTRTVPIIDLTRLTNEN